MTVDPAVRVSGYSHVAIHVTDLDAARDFYCRLLGFGELDRPDFGVPGMWLRVGDLQLHFVESEDMPANGRTFPHFALYVATADFAPTMAALQEAGVTFLGQPASRVDFGRTVWAAFVADPSGNVVELTDVGPLPAAG